MLNGPSTTVTVTESEGNIEVNLTTKRRVESIELKPGEVLGYRLTDASWHAEEGTLFDDVLKDLSRIVNEIRAS